LGESISNKNILITGCRFFYALELARLFYRAGHKVFVADSMKLHLCKYSKCVSQTFLIPSYRFDFKNFEKELKRIINEYRIDIIIPVFEETLYLAKIDPSVFENCELFCSPFPILYQLHNKWLFSKLQNTFDIPTLPAKLIKDYGDLKNVDFYPYALKPCYSRSAFKIQKIISKDSLPDIDITEKKPWVAQKWMNGDKYCTYSICKNGKILAHTVYPNKTIGGYCLSFISIEHSKILKWIENFVCRLNFTGQISFDFIESEEGLFALECNPRATSGLHLLAVNPDLAKYFTKTDIEIYQPPIGISKLVGFGMLLYAFTQREVNQSRIGCIKKHLKYKDIIFYKEDLKPFFFQFFVFTSFILKCFKYKLPIPQAFIHDIIWDEEMDLF
jgi:predicted ATP-grasp superfamily ATP-dependent carboligase